jgi:dTDP-4-dehydrorhamnose reductase
MSKSPPCWPSWLRTSRWSFCPVIWSSTVGKATTTKLRRQSTGVYAETKASAEQIILANPRHTVVRTSLNGGISPTRDRGFNEQMRLAWQAGQRMKLFTDEFRSPIPAEVTARAIWELAAPSRPGLYHVAGSERLSRWEIGQLLAARWPQLKPRIEPGSLREYSGAPRAPDTSLNCAKAQTLLSFPLPGLTKWLAAQPDEAF